MDAILQTLARELERSPEHVQNVATLIDEGATIPFIARYRKELHGSMDDQLLRRLADRLQYLRNLEARKEVAAAIENQGKLTQELSDAIAAAATLAEVEDLYRPYKQKRRTRATIAREKGLEPLARLLSAQGPAVDPRQAALDFLGPDKGVETAEDALQGPVTSWPRRSPTTPTSAGSCGSCICAGACWPPGLRPRSRRTRSTACTMTSRSRWAGPRATRCWPSTEVSGRGCSRSRWSWTRRPPTWRCAGPWCPARPAWTLSGRRRTTPMTA